MQSVGLRKLKMRNETEHSGYDTPTLGEEKKEATFEYEYGEEEEGEYDITDDFKNKEKEKEDDYF